MAPAANVGGFNFTLLHTQETYAAVVAVDDYNNACVPYPDGTYDPGCYGGVARRMTFIKETHAAFPNVLLLDTGNILIGNSGAINT